MKFSDPNANTKIYQCVQAKTGCNDNYDCHLGVGVCYCYGPSCLDSGDAVTGTTDFRTKVRGLKSGGHAEGVNAACSYRPLASCHCNKDWSGGLKSRSIY